MHVTQVNEGYNKLERDFQISKPHLNLNNGLADRSCKRNEIETKLLAIVKVCTGN